MEVRRRYYHRGVCGKEPTKRDSSSCNFVIKLRQVSSNLTKSNVKNLGSIDFSKSDKGFNPVHVNDTNLKVVNHAKLLGLNVSRDLKWNIHISEIVKKAASRLYFLRQLKRSKAASKELTQFYITCIRPVTEYACQVYHNSLPNYLSNDLECLQKRAMRIIHPERSYS